MTDNQEKELFSTLAALVTGVNAIQSDVKDLKSDVQSIKETQYEHSRTLNEHSRILNRLDAKTDSIAEIVMTNDKRLTAVEKNVAELRDGIH